LRPAIPIDVAHLDALRCNWEALKGRLVEKIDAAYGVYVFADRPGGPARASFSARRFAQWLAREGIPWPRLDSGQLALDDDSGA
jgi:hypothetical protein